MEVSSCGVISSVSDKGDWRAGCNLVSDLFEQFFVMLVYGNYIAFVLDLDRVARIFAPSGENYSSVQGGLNHRARWSCDVDIWMNVRVISLRNNTFERCEEVKSLNRKVALVSC